MLVVKLEIHPGGDSSRAEEIGRLEIANISDLAPVSDYSYEFHPVRKPFLPLRGIVSGHKRDQPMGAWKLVRKVLVHVFGVEP
jgi:hypothetical protein